LDSASGILMLVEALLAAVSTALGTAARQRLTAVEGLRGA